MPRSYWIAHPTERGFISARSPEGVGQVLMMAERWPAGLYAMWTHGEAPSPTEREDRHWGQVVKDADGNVWIEAAPSQ